MKSRSWNKEKFTKIVDLLLKNFEKMDKQACLDLMTEICRLYLPSIYEVYMNELIEMYEKSSDRSKSFWLFNDLVNEFQKHLFVKEEEEEKINLDDGSLPLPTLTNTNSSLQNELVSEREKDVLEFFADEKNRFKVLGTLSEIFEKNIKKIQNAEIKEKEEGEKEKEDSAFVSGFISIERTRLNEFVDPKTFENDVLKIVNSLKNSRP